MTFFNSRLISHHVQLHLILMQVDIFLVLFHEQKKNQSQREFWEIHATHNLQSTLLKQVCDRTWCKSIPCTIHIHNITYQAMVVFQDALQVTPARCHSHHVAVTTISQRRNWALLCPQHLLKWAKQNNFKNIRQDLLT